MIENSIMDFIICALLGFITWFFGGIDGLLQVLIAFTIIDYITGIIAAGLNHELSSRVGFRGIMRKVEMFLFVGMAHLLDSYFPGDAGNIRTFVCLFYIVNEGISIIENAEKIGVPIPKPLHNMLAKLHDMTNNSGNTQEIKPAENLGIETADEINTPDLIISEDSSKPEKVTRNKQEPKHERVK